MRHNRYNFIYTSIMYLNASQFKQTLEVKFDKKK